MIINILYRMCHKNPPNPPNVISRTPGLSAQVSTGTAGGFCVLRIPCEWEKGEFEEERTAGEKVPEMLAGAAVQPLGCLRNNVSPGFDVRKDPGEEVNEPGNVAGIRSIHWSAVRIACGSGDVVVGAGGSESLGGKVEDAVVEGEEVVVGIEAIEEGEGGVEVQGRDLGADRGPEAAIPQPLGNGPGNGDSRRWFVVLVLLLGGPDSLGCLRSLFEEGNELGGEEVFYGRRIGELHPLDAIKVVVVVALVGAEPNVGVWEEGAEDLSDADVATLQKNTLEDGVLGAAPSVNLVGVWTVGPCCVSQPVLWRTLSVTREGSPL